jgi:hypothetical protein
MTPLTCEFWQGWCSVTFSDPWSHHCEGSKRNYSHRFSLWPTATRKSSFQIILFDHIEATLRFCVSHRRCPSFDLLPTIFTSALCKIFRQIKQLHVLWEELWEEGSRQTQRGIKQESLQLLWSMSAASVSIPCALGRSAVFCKSCWWVKWNCGCTQTRSCKLLLIELPPLHVAVELLLMLLLWSIKESDLAQGNCTCCTVDEYIIASQKHWQLLSLSLSLSLLTIQERAN